MRIVKVCADPGAGIGENPFGHFARVDIAGRFGDKVKTIEMGGRGNTFNVTGTDDNGQTVSAQFTTDQAIEAGKIIGTLRITDVCRYFLNQAK